MREPDTTSSRAELPSSPEALAPMGPAFDGPLAAGLAELSIDDRNGGSDLQRRLYEVHARMLREWGQAMNLTAINEPAEVARRHVCDSLSAVPHLAGRTISNLLDLGSGAGYPGLPLAIALRPDRVALLDSVGKKARFLQVAADAVIATWRADEPSPGAEGSVPRIEAITERAEDLAQMPDRRESWDVVTARAVGSLAEVVELAMPLVREGGLVVAWKREDERHGLRAELRDAGAIIRATGGGRPQVVAIDAPSLPGHRLVMVPKEHPTPSHYPRPVAKRPRRKR